MITLMFLFGGILAACFLIWLLVKFKILRIPSELAAYQHFDKKVTRIGEVVGFLWLLPFVLRGVLSMITKESMTVSGGMWLYLSGGAAVTFGIFSFSYFCPRCGRLLGLPVRFIRNALEQLTAGSCPGCGFSFDETRSSPPR